MATAALTRPNPTVSAVSAAPGMAPQSRRGRAPGTPQRIRRFIVIVIVLSVAWGAAGAWAMYTRASAAASLAHADEPYSNDAQQLYLKLADADVTITTSFLEDSQPLAPGATPPSSLAARQRFDADIAAASADLVAMRSASGSPEFSAAATSIVNGMPVYQGDVKVAETEYAQGIIPAGDSAMEVASEDAHLTLLPAAKTLYAIESQATEASGSQATDWLPVLIALVVALAAALALLRIQWWLRHVTHRFFNRGLVVATVVLVAGAAWLAGTFAAARADLSAAIGQGVSPAGSLAQASIDVQQIRGDSVLNVIARSGSPSLQQDSTAQSAAVGSAQGGLLASARADGNAQVAADLGPVFPRAAAWYAINAKGYALGAQSRYSAEQDSVVVAAAGDYGAVLSGISKALSGAQSTFTAKADDGSAALATWDWLVPVVLAACVAVAAGWGLDERLKEYR